MKLTLIFHEMKLSLINDNYNKFLKLEKKYNELTLKNDKIKS